MDKREPDPSLIDWAKFFGPGDLAEPISVKKSDAKTLASLRRVLDDFLFESGRVDAPRGPIVLSEGGTVSRPPGPTEEPEDGPSHDGGGRCPPDRAKATTSRHPLRQRGY